MIRFGFRQNTCSRGWQNPSDIHVAGNFQTLPSSTELNNFLILIRSRIRENSEQLSENVSLESLNFYKFSYVSSRSQQYN